MNEKKNGKEKSGNKFTAFLKKKDIEFSVQRYFVDAMGNMALGLFASLLIGTIFGTVASFVPNVWLAEKIGLIADYSKQAAGPAMAVAIAFALKAPPLVLFSCAAVGVAANELGGPVGVFIAVIICAEFGKLVSKQTKVDILVTPAVTIISGISIAMLAGPPVSALMRGLGNLVMLATELRPFGMGMLVSMIVGLVLTLPISSAALCVMLGLGGLAAGAATAGCCAQMVGFAVMSFRENRWGGLVSQGLGTSMLQMPNIIRNPRIWLPPTVASIITGPIATVVFKLENIPVGAGMGTSGLVGPIGIITAMGSSANVWLGILLVCFVLPALLSWGIALLLRKIGWIKEGDLTLNM